MEDISTFLRNAIKGDMEGFRKPATEVWKQVIKKPAQPSPQQAFSNFMKMSQEERLGVAQEMGPDNYKAFTEEMVNVGIETMGPTAEDLRQYFEQDLAMLQTVASSQQQQYDSLIQQALANPMAGFETDGSDTSLPAEIPDQII